MIEYFLAMFKNNQEDENKMYKIINYHTFE